LIIDCHSHIWDLDWQPARYQESIAKHAAHRRLPVRDYKQILPKVMGNIHDPQGDNMIRDMDAAGVDATVLMMLDNGIGCAQECADPLSILDAHIAACERHAGRLYAFYGVDPRRPYAVSALKDAIGRGIRGVKIYPPNGYFPYEAPCYRLYDVALEANLPVLCHTGHTATPLRSRFARPMYLGDVVADYPDLTVIVGHAGRMPWWHEAVAIATRAAHVYLDLSTWWQAQKEFGEEQFLRNLRYMISEVGIQKVLWGMDRSSGPKKRDDLDTAIAYWQELPDRAAHYGISISAEEVDLMMGGNIAQVLGL
jgi:predicted TIM-barrel fold metal-dependent hydrolase